MKTEDDAKGTYCAIIQAHCKGTGCMQWRWHFDTAQTIDMNRAQYEREGFKVVGWSSGQLGPVAHMARKTDLGFCGLAGAPALGVE